MRVQDWSPTSSASGPPPGANLCARMRDQAGDTLIEVMISAAILLVVALGALAGFSASGKTTSRERQYAEAVALAQRDQEELRAQPTSNLANLDTTNSKFSEQVGGTTYQIWHTGTYVSHAGTSSCTSGGTASADYILLQSYVAYGQPNDPSFQHPVTASGIVNPPNGDNLVVHVTDGSTKVPTVGVPIAVYDNTAGASAGSGVTDANGCLVFPNVADDNYTVTANNPSQDLTTTNTSPATTIVSVVSGSGAIAPITYAPYGTISVAFSATDPHSNKSFTAAGDSFVTQAGSNAATTFYASGNSAQSPPTSAGFTTPIDKLFPFAYTDSSGTTTGTYYSVYAGTCTANAPSDGSAASVPLVPISTHDYKSATVILSPLELKTNLSGAIDPTLISLKDTDTGTNCAQVRDYTGLTSTLQAPPPTTTYGIPSAPAGSDHYALGDWVMYVPQGNYSVCANVVSGGFTWVATGSVLINSAAGNGGSPLQLNTASWVHKTTTPINNACP